jgi:hypothetical protein
MVFGILAVELDACPSVLYPVGSELIQGRSSHDGILQVILVWEALIDGAIQTGNSQYPCSGRFG